MDRPYRIFSLVLFLSATIASAADWPQWRGPERNSISPETNLLPDWNQAKPTLLWQATGLGSGYATFAIVGNRMFTTGDRGEDEFVVAMDRETHKVLWSTRVGKAWTSAMPGARCTPTVDGDLLYVVGPEGYVACLEAASGKEVWRKSFAEFGGMMMSVWGYAESPLVDGEKVLCTPGGGDAMIVALNKKTGEVIWKTAMKEVGSRGKDGAGYSSLVIANVNGIRHYVTIVGRGAIGVAADDGRLLWSYNRIANDVANIPTPVVQNDHVFVATGYPTGGSAVVRISADGKGLKAEEVWYHDARTFQNHHGGVVLVGEHLYGGHGQNKGIPTCVEFKTGKIVWQQTPQPGKGSAAVLYAEGNLYYRLENGLMTLIAASPAGYQLKGSFQAPVVTGPAWSHPVIVDGLLYLRDNDTLMCYDIRRK